MKKITIIGAGIAGLTAALRLAERGYEVTIFERDSFIGGKFRATKWEGKGTKRFAFHEHSYHMFLNWYHNFWQIAQEIGAEDQFIPLTKVNFLNKGEFPRMKELVNFGAPASICQNLLSGVLSVPDMFLYMYSVLDLLSTPMTQDRYRDLISVNAFASTKPYTTENSAGMYDEYLAKTFAIASYESSAKTFQTFLEYGTYCPDPLFWSLKGDCYNNFLRLLEARLSELGVRIIFHNEATGIAINADGNVSSVIFQVLPDIFDPTLSEMASETAMNLPLFTRHKRKKHAYEHKVDGPLIVAVPHAILSQLLSPDLLNRDIALGETTKLQSAPMASVHLHLNNKFSQRLKHMGAKLPREPIILVNSKYKLSFVNNSRLWPGLRDTYFNIVASDSRPLDGLLAPPVFTADRDFDAIGLGLSIEKPATTLDHILKEFRRFVPFEDDEIDEELLQIDRNVGRELFINEVGSWKWRPETRTKVKNLFLAGDFCKNFIDVVCLEGAMVSGLQAAECVRRECGLGAPIKIARPKRYPYPLFWPLKLALAPYAAGAKLWSVLSDVMKRVDE
jgi:flavin-dependent amine oxidoreductase